MFAEERLDGSRAELVQISADSQGDLLGVENLTGGVGGAVLGAAAALDAGVGLQRDDLRQILAGIQAEIVIAYQGRDFRETAASKKHREGTQHQMQVFGVGNQGQENQQG